MIEFFIAKKHMLVRKKQSFISIIGIMIGVLVLTVSIGISNGLDKNMISSVLSISSHILIQSNSTIENYKEVEKKIMGIKGVKGVVSNVPSQGIIKFKGAFGDYVAGVKIQGFDLEAAKKAMNLDKKIILGEIKKDRDSILIGSEMSKNANINLDEEVTLVTPDGKDIKFKVSGIFQTGYYDYDANVVMINLQTAQYINYTKDSVKELNVILDNPYKADEINHKIFKEQGMLGRTWGQLNRNLLSALALEKTVMIIVFSLIVVIAGFVVWVTLNMLVREKIKDIGILRAMGFSKKNIGKIFLFQGLTLGVLGIASGVSFALFILWYIKNYSLPGVTSIYYIQKIPVEISVKEIMIIVLANLIIIVLSSVLPSYTAAKMETQEALKHE
ncbi:MAG: ABC transporter permease [Fusobacteriaceae bacterium]